LTIAEQHEHESYRIIVLSRCGTEVLLVQNGECHMLPWVEIPRWHRVAENITSAVTNDWGEEVVCLFEPALESPIAGINRYQAAEHLCTRGTPKLPTRWMPISALKEVPTPDECDHTAIKNAAGVCNGVIQGIVVGPFARLGWFGELRNWVESFIEPMGIHGRTEFQQLNASDSFSLIRFETDGPAVWFKAVGEPNQREFPITSALAQLLPDYLPQMLATRPDWNGWLSWEVNGKPLSEVQDEADWVRAAETLASMQRQSVDHNSRILCAGAHDLRPAVLSKRVQPFMSALAELMESQTKVPPPTLGHQDLQLLADSLHSALDALASMGIPETLGHLDPNPGNIIVSENRCAFLDWAEAYVGHPFFSLEYLLQHARRTFGDAADITTKMIAAYCPQWDGMASSSEIVSALAFASLVAVFAYATGSEIWKSERLQEGTVAGYVRSLARRMHREAVKLADRRVLCLQ